MLFRSLVKRLLMVLVLLLVRQLVPVVPVLLNVPFVIGFLKLKILKMPRRALLLWVLSICVLTITTITFLNGITRLPSIMTLKYLARKEKENEA